MNTLQISSLHVHVASRNLATCRSMYIHIALARVEVWGRNKEPTEIQRIAELVGVHVLELATRRFRLLRTGNGTLVVHITNQQKNAASR